jgi:hypothetical protein
VTKIKIEIDTDSSYPPSIHSVGRALSTPLIQGIGIVSSIPYTATMTTSFNAGLSLVPTQTLPVGPGQVYIPIPLASLGFGTQAIQNAITQLNSNSNIGLIVTFGGNVTFNAAIQCSQKPFISLIGGLAAGTSSPGSGYFIGAVSIESFNADANRISDLVNNKPKVNPNEIWLLYDPRTPMGPIELNLNAWGGAVPATNGVGDPTKFNLDFANIPKQAKAVVISASPYFTEYLENIIDAANSSKLWICYPLLDYANKSGTHKPSHNLATLFGPNLCSDSNNAYGSMGTMAYTVLCGQALKPALVQLTSTPSYP